MGFGNIFSNMQQTEDQNYNNFWNAMQSQAGNMGADLQKYVTLGDQGPQGLQTVLGDWLRKVNVHGKSGYDLLNPQYVQQLMSMAPNMYNQWYAGQLASGQASDLADNKDGLAQSVMDFLKPGGASGNNDLMNGYGFWNGQQWGNTISNIMSNINKFENNDHSVNAALYANLPYNELMNIMNTANTETLAPEAAAGYQYLYSPIFQQATQSPTDDWLNLLNNLASGGVTPSYISSQPGYLSNYASAIPGSNRNS